MSDNPHSRYWQDAVAEALEEAGVHATPSQVLMIAASMEVSHDNHGMAFGSDAIPNPLHDEVEREQRNRDEDRKDHEEEVFRLKKQNEDLKWRIQTLEMDLREAKANAA